MDQRATLPTIWDTAPSSSGGVDRSAFVGRKPSKVIPVPRDYRRQVLSRERDLLINDVKEKTNCDIVPHWDRGAQGQITSFDIYGSGQGLDKAIRHLNDWISKAPIKSIGSSAWAKLPAYDFNKWYYEQVEEMDDEYKQQFKGPVPFENDRDAPRHTAVVKWPGDLSDQSRTPRDVFGNKLERLNGLRMQDKVYITLLPQTQDGLWQLEILGYDVIDVEAATQHLDTIVATIRADAAGVQDALNIIMDEREGLEIKLQQDESWWPNHADSVVPRLLPHPLMDQSGSFRQEGLHYTQLSSLQQFIKLALDSVRHRKGAYDFVVRLGSLVLKSSKHVSADRIGQTYSKETFQKQIKNGPIELDVKKWLANDGVGYRILHSLMGAKGFLAPTKSGAYFGYTPEHLEQTRPIFRGTWVFIDPSSAIVPNQATNRHIGRPLPLQKPVENTEPSLVSLFVIQIDWTDDEEGMYEKGTPTFYKLPPGQKGPTKNMDINLLELGESRAWHFALESLTPVSKKMVSPALVGFADQVKMKLKYDITSTESFANWDMTPTARKYLQTGRLESIYSFGIEKTCYKVELTAMWYPQQKLPVWGLAVRHNEWATHLAELESLAIGRQASWDEDTISTFFPDNGLSSSYIDEDSEDYSMRKLNIKDGTPHDGIRILTDKLMKLSEIVSSVTDSSGVRT